MRETVGTKCGRYGHPEFTLFYRDALDADADVLLKFLEDSVRKGARYRDGQTLQFGWSLLVVRNLPDGRLTFEELDLSGIPGQLTRSVEHTLRCTRHQKDVVESFQLEAEPDFPSVVQTAVKCTRYPDPGGILLSRVSPEENDSGWFFGCRDAAHDHQEPGHLAGDSLYAIACEAHNTIRYLAMPNGSHLLLDARGDLEEATLEGRGRLRIRPGSFLDRLQRRSDRT